MKPHRQMLEQIDLATRTLWPALPESTRMAGAPARLAVRVDYTRPVHSLLTARLTATSAVYVTWDVRGRCRYVGSVRRPAARAAARDRIKEHLDDDVRRGHWYAVTVLPLRTALTLEQVRLCEGWAARVLRPLEGSAHPRVSVEVTLHEALQQTLGD